MWSDDDLALAARVLDRGRSQGKRIATVESCTGGLVAAVLTAIPGSSDVFDRGFVTYSNSAKTDLVAVPPDMIAAHGAVSAPVAKAMAAGGIACSAADLCVAVTGVAGPGASERKPAGLVFLAVADRQSSGMVVEKRYPGDRGAVRAAAMREALELLARA